VDLLKQVRELRKGLTVISIRQHQALGLGHAVMRAKAVAGQEAFAVLLGDEIMITGKGKPTGIGQLKKLAEDTELSTVAVINVEKNETSRYGIIEGKPAGKNLWKVTGVVEKPNPLNAPSTLALPGRYIFSPKIFNILEKTKPGKNGEIQLSDAMNTLAKKDGMMATVLNARRFDAGDKLGYLKANVELGLEHPEIGKAFREYIKSVAKKGSI
jgi:UTP--glucose-1-phosphate uridylyltransferase